MVNGIVKTSRTVKGAFFMREKIGIACAWCDDACGRQEFR